MVLKDTFDTKSKSGPSKDAGTAVLRKADGVSARSSTELVSDPLSTFDGVSSASISSLPNLSFSIDSTGMSLCTDVVALQMFYDDGSENFRQVAWTPDSAYVPYHEEYGGAATLSVSLVLQVIIDVIMLKTANFSLEAFLHYI